MPDGKVTNAYVEGLEGGDMKIMRRSGTTQLEDIPSGTLFKGRMNGPTLALRVYQKLEELLAGATGKGKGVTTAGPPKYIQILSIPVGQMFFGRESPDGRCFLYLRAGIAGVKWNFPYITTLPLQTLMYDYRPVHAMLVACNTTEELVDLATKVRGDGFSDWKEEGAYPC